ncbi:hypothetical protein QGM71_01135 [Virgibacillus sp. C22-A2]|uniref:Conjugal transfer protein n=1 Tax=Virgibacillus tibetensis TaxID=3042313 RepID=A0ABU6KAM2_9BACI|nr:hypothetical protein [Virgibacillus sp. C22-A2]
MALVANGLAGNKNKGEREKNDFYPTPPHATESLLNRVNFEGSVWEPACGDGAICKVLEEKEYKVYATDKYDRGYGVYDIDFLTWDWTKTFNHRPANIITNPPYKIAQEFVERSLECTTGKVAMLLKLNFLESARRYEMFNNTPLKHVLVFSKRLNFYEGTLEGNKRSGVLAFAWYVWEHGYEGQPQIDWIL